MKRPYGGTERMNQNSIQRRSIRAFRKFMFNGGSPGIGEGGHPAFPGTLCKGGVDGASDGNENGVFTQTHECFRSKDRIGSC
jgi:hypothetical protein